MPRSDKALKEAFVSNLTGSSTWDINAVTLVAPMAIFLWSALQSRQQFFKPYTPQACVTDFLLNCGAILLATTMYSSAPLLLNGLLLAPAMLIGLSEYLSKPPPRKEARKRKEQEQPKEDIQSQVLPVKPFVTHYRGAMMIVTCIAILAVDFHVFPRRFAKAETWGTSLMDMGVGSFVFSSGVVSARGLLKDMNSGKASSLGQRLWGSFRHSLPLIVLGFIRLYSVKGLDYAEHVAEYGVHWNFFFTLGLLPPFVALFQSVLAVLPSYAGLSLLLAIAYELALDLTDLQKFIITAPRTNLFNKNREGIFSFFGYFAIFLAGQATGLYTLPKSKPLLRRPNGLSSRVEQLRKTVFGQLIVWSFVWSALFAIATAYNGFGLQVSRRLANLPYVLWVAAFNCGQLTLFCGIEAFCFPYIHGTSEKDAASASAAAATSQIMYAFNRNGLAIFLLANLLTGLVNLTVNTLRTSNLYAMGVLILYIATISSVALGLDWWDVSIKL